MRYPTTLFRSLLTLALVAGILGWTAANAAEKQGVVIQVSNNNPHVWTLALHNAHNLQTDIGKDKVNIEIVAYGPGINMVRRNSKVAKGLHQAIENGVAIKACENTMRAFHLTRKDIYPGVGFVPSGVAEIIAKERAGWSYIRP